MHSHFKFRSQRKPAQMKSPYLDFCNVMKNLARSPEFIESCRVHFVTLKTTDDRSKPWLERQRGDGPCSRSIGNSRALREVGFWLRRADSGRMRRAHQRRQNGRKLRKSPADYTQGDGPCSRGTGGSIFEVRQHSVFRDGEVRRSENGSGVDVFEKPSLSQLTLQEFCMSRCPSCRLDF